MDNDIIVGLGGHIDHGKTSLIKCLNGFDGDESIEEKERGITLDISFSDLKTQKRQIAFIDVPGHHKLIKNMIAGAFGIDVMLLVVAFDDGIMPQTIEHLEIANFLGIKQAVCVISKIDLCEDETRLLELKDSVVKLFEKFNQIHLKEVVFFSIFDLKTHKNLLNILDNIPKFSNKSAGFFRYYIDRSFSLKGIGSVVSGSIISGSISCDKKVYVCELDKELTIKSLQTHNKNVLEAFTSHRVAINLSGISSSELQRGFLLTQKGYMRGFDQIDVILFPLDKKDLHNKTFQLFIGAKRSLVKVIVLEQAKDGVFATLKSDTKIFSIFKERFILRDEERNIAGGMVLNPIIDPMKKNQKIKLLEALFLDDLFSAFQLISSAHKRGFGLISSSQRFCLNHQEILEIAQNISSGYLDDKNLVLYHQESLDILEREILKIFDKNPLALLSAKALSLKIAWASPNVLSFVLEKLYQGGLITKNQNLYLSIKNKLDDLNHYVRDRIYQILLDGKFSPQAPYNIYDLLDIDRKIGDDALKELCASQKVVRLAHNLFVPTQTLQTLIQEMRLLLEKNGYLNLEILREAWGISRKYLIAYLDYLDSFADIINESGRRVLRYSH
ncbi:MULTISPECIES: selenocysteine-specific translation elongation factor [unclassified Helicobacter]|uniref:selenocysteine-specific translation elongation factor n=1 Tax=unclassified Helicobacter TaxID=2593540 RepID=UPI000CF0716D|nr:MULTISPECIES: selenocysteine-specific translation elongation factor [unclassified Helicobacter]